MCGTKKPIDRAGSCGLFSFFFNGKIYIGNVGDSRAIISRGFGKSRIGITVDHKPDEKGESERIKRNGGQVYKTQPKLPLPENTTLTDLKLPWRVFPGRLSVSRTFGDIAAKKEEYEGRPGVVIAEPDVFEIESSDDLDFVLLACDGVFDRLENEEVIDKVWTEIESKEFSDIHTACEYFVHLIFRMSVQKMSYDNISIIFVAMKGFRDRVKVHSTPT
jgi:protein phosphatase 2C family protein 2/3